METQMDVKKKAGIYRKKFGRTMLLSTLKPIYPEDKTYRRALSIVNEIYNRLDIKDDGIYAYDLLESLSDKVRDIIANRWPHPVTQRTMVQTLLGLHTKCGFGDSVHLYASLKPIIDKVTEDIKTNSHPKDVPDWPTVKEQLLAIANDNSSALPRRIVCCFWGNGYVFRNGEIFDMLTSDDGNSNYLDLSTGVYTRRQQKNGKVEIINIDPATVEAICKIRSQYLRHSDYVIGKQFRSDRTRVCSYHNIPYGNDSIRESISTYIKKYGTEEKYKLLCKVLGHSIGVSDAFYVET